MAPSKTLRLVLALRSPIVPYHPEAATPCFKCRFTSEPRKPGKRCTLQTLPRGPAGKQERQEGGGLLQQEEEDRQSGGRNSMLLSSQTKSGRDQPMHCIVAFLLLSAIQARAASR